MGFRRVVAQWWGLGAVVILGVVAAMDITGHLGPVLRRLAATSARPESATVVNAITAVGTFAAALVALYIATKDRRERRHERDTEDRTRANLIAIEIDGSEVRNVTAPAFRVVVYNHSGSAVLGVRVPELLIDGEPSRQHFLPVDASLPFVAFKYGANSFRLEPANEEMAFAMRGTAIPTSDDYLHNPENHKPTITEDTKIFATVEFTDAGGKTWQKTSNGVLVGPFKNHLPNEN